MMKVWAAVLLTVLFAACGVAEEPAFVIKEVTCSTVRTPVALYDKVKSSASSKKRWIRLSVKFTPKEGKILWHDNVTMEGMLIIERQEKYKGQPSYLVLTGETRYFTVRADGKEHPAVFFVPPQLLERYLGDTAQAMKGVRLFRVRFYGPGRTLLGEAYWSMLGSGKGGELLRPASKPYIDAAATMQRFEKPLRNVAAVAGGLVSREKTPWAHIDYDRYDLILEKPQAQTGRRNADEE